MTGNEVRRKYLEYFQKHHHKIVRSSSLVPQDDPTLLFTNAGMVQFKRAFLGEEKRGYVRATTSQKCVRAGGKHNDLENVGYTARHHTFFEMLGNFSFGDYFKEKAIEFAWDLLTNGYGLPGEKLYASVYLDDDEAYDLWHQRIGIPEERVVRFGEEDNFWSMGDTGPCGPCSELLLDRGESYGCGRPDCRVGCECDRYLEIWNLVFMQFNRDASGKMTPLPKPSIDTGLGLERMVTLLQDVPTNYETDLLLPIIEKVEDLSEKKMGESAEDDVAMKVIADHSRAAAFLIGDGVLPSNVFRGYVLRRIMRRAIRYGRKLGLDKPFLDVTASVVFDIMKDAYPDLMASKAFITNVIHNEETRFSETLDFGLNLLNDTLSDLRAKGTDCVPGSVIFKLYDTYGFPVDIVRDVVRDEKMALDMDGFESAMEAQREKSRSVTAFSELGDAYRELSAKGVNVEFLGYDQNTLDATILVLVSDGKEVASIEEGMEVELVTGKTPFYGESGGQAGDIGTITASDNDHSFLMEVTNTIKDPTGLIIHRGRVLSGKIQRGEEVTLTVDMGKRNATASNHTATHILHHALRKVLGDHVKQAGSLVAPDRFRFDFTHFSQVGPDLLDEIESIVNKRIRDNVAVQTQEMDAEDAFKSGATALFEEKYGDRVRVVSLADFSKELCGGTHTKQTGNIGLFKIVSESSIASGVRRIEALTGEAALNHLQKTVHAVQEAAGILRVKPDAVPKRIQKLLEQLKNNEKDINQLKAKILGRSSSKVLDEVVKVNDVKLLVKKIDADSPAALRNIADRYKEQIKSGIIVLGSRSGSKALLLTAVTRDLTGQYHAGKIVNKLAVIVGGGGGGRPDMAQAGGPNPENLDKAMEAAADIIAGIESYLK
ncbi:MAG: alanine--tRNA ligase [Deltaproteobacteria bacterium]|nr:MAG: alanine--tRNA ligase [Deltaproteobacteria bacterium]